MQEAEHNACTSPLSHRMPIADIPLPDQLRHVQGALWHFAVVRCELNTFTQTTFTPLASEKDQQAAMQDCMRLHASMWSSAAVTKSTSTTFTVAKHSSHTFLLWYPCFPIVHLCLWLCTGSCSSPDTLLKGPYSGNPLSHFAVRSLPTCGSAQ